MNLSRLIPVLLLLTSGPTPLRHIYALNCFVKPTGERVSWKVFTRGMRKLAQKKYLKIISCGYAAPEYGPQAALLLNLGASFLCTKRNLDPGDFRMTHPKPANIDHELKLTEIVNTIKRGSFQNRYLLKSISDDTQVRKKYMEKGQSLKGVYLADIETVIRATKTDNTAEVTTGFYIEYDNGNKGRSYWAKKLNSWARDIIVITRDARRSELVAKYIAGSRLGICILSIEEFNKLGLLECAKIHEKFKKSKYDSAAAEWKQVA